MKLERIQYKIYKLLPIIIPIAVLIVAIICIVVGRMKGSRDQPDNIPTITPGITTTPIGSEDALTLPEHLRNNCVHVESTLKNNYDRTEWFETYYDHLSGNFEQYRITVKDGVKQYEKLLEPCLFSGLPDKIGTVLDELPTGCKDYKFNRLDENMYSVSSLDDGYIWLAKQKELGNTLDLIKITASYMDVYFKEDKQQKRAIITDKYILVDDYIGNVPLY